MLAAFFIVAGTLHFLFTDVYARIVPPGFPAPRALVLVSGIGEILGGAAVLVPHLRRRAGYGLILLLIAVFPANIYMAGTAQSIGGISIPPALLWLRLPLQFILIAWVWICTRPAAPTRAPSGHAR